MSAIQWAAKRAYGSPSLGVHIHSSWDSIGEDPARLKESQRSAALELEFVITVDLLGCAEEAASKLKECIQTAESLPCHTDEIWLQVCHL